METIYRFYLFNNSDECHEYNSSKISKEEMEFDIIYNIYPNCSHCTREKWVNWELKYRNVFLLEARRKDSNFINNFKLWIEQE